MISFMPRVEIVPDPAKLQPHDVPLQPGERAPFFLKNLSNLVPRITTGEIIRGVVEEGSKSFGWLHRVFLLVKEHVGEHVGQYVKTYVTGWGNAWAGVWELTSFSGRGVVNAGEIDLMTVGVDPDQKARRGLLMVFGKSVLEHPWRVFIDVGLSFVPFGFRQDHVFVQNVIDMRSLPAQNALCLRPGTWTTWDREAMVGEVWDEETGLKYQGRKGLPFAFAWQMETGDLYIKGRKVRWTFEPEGSHVQIPPPPIENYTP